MQEITKLDVTRKQLSAEHFYYDGCEAVEDTSAEAQHAADTILDLAAEVLLQIYEQELRQGENI